MPTDENFKQDPERYARLRVPFENRDVALEAVDEFQSLLSVARESCRIPDFCGIIEIHFLREDGTERNALIPIGFGDEKRAPLLAAFLYGRERKIISHKLLNAVAQGEASIIDELKEHSETVSDEPDLFSQSTESPA